MVSVSTVHVSRGEGLGEGTKLLSLVTALSGLQLNIIILFVRITVKPLPQPVFFLPPSFSSHLSSLYAATSTSPMRCKPGGLVCPPPDDKPGEEGGLEGGTFGVGVGEDWTTKDPWFLLIK